MAERKGSGKSHKSRNGSAKSLTDTVSKLTVRALQSLNLSEVEDVNAPKLQVNEETNETESTGEKLSENKFERGGGGDESHSLPVNMENFDDEADVDVDDHDDDVGDTDRLYEGGGGDGDVDDSGMDAGLDSEESDLEEEEPMGEEQPQNDLVVLDPDHPLMKRFQNAYKDHLTKQDQKVSLELRELNEELNSYMKQREEIGVELYGVQQELARQQLALDKLHDRYNEKTQVKLHWEMKLGETKTLHKQVQNDLTLQRKKANELQSEVEDIASKLLYMEAAKEDVRSDISVLKRAADKSDAEGMKAQIEKKRQDLLVNKLVTKVDRLRSDIAMYDAQIDAQKEEMKAATRNLTEAATELEAIELEKKQLLQQWNNSLIGMRRRDEAHSAIQEAVSMQSQQIQAIETELEGYKRQILKAQEQNEQLTYMSNRIESDITSVKKQVIICQNKHEAIKIEYSTYSRALNETESQLGRVQTDVNIRESELNNVRKLIEKEFLEKVKLEDQLLSKMQGQLTADKASQYTKKMREKIRRKATETERAVAEVENEISKDVLEIVNATTRVRGLQDILNNINKVIYQKNETISKIENEIVKRNAVIEKKQGTIDQMNKRIDSMINKNGDDAYVGPLELQIKTLQRQIESTSGECLELQQYWLRQQSDLVKIIRSVNEQHSEIESKKKQSTIMMQKKLRIEGDVGSQKNEINDIERNIRSMQNDMTKLNVLIHRNRDKHQSLQQDNILMEHDFITALKDAELESVKIQTHIQGLNEEKERLLNAVVESERQILLWEKKTKLAREARDTVNSEVGQGEIHAMKAEIHRMEVRYAQLMRQQEKMMQDMEKSVFKRECIIVRGDALAKMERKKMGQPKMNAGTFHKKLSEMKKKIKQTNLEASQVEHEMKEVRDVQQELGTSLETKQSNTQRLQQSVDLQHDDIERMQELKQKNLADIISKQQRGKYYTSLKAGKYTRLCKTVDGLQNEREKQEDRLQNISTLVDRAVVDYPELQTAFRDMSLSIGYREEVNTERSSLHRQVDVV